MIRKKIILTPILSLLLISATSLFPQQPASDSLEQFTFLNRQLNVIQYKNKKIVEQFLAKWEKSKTETITVAHFGDSHIQPDTYTGQVRKQLQSITGDGGRGMVFPFAVAKTYSAQDFISSYKGEWSSSNSIQDNPVLPLGPSGFSARTTDPQAQFTITFKKPFNKKYRLVKLYCKKAPTCFDMQLNCGNYTITAEVNNSGYDKPYIELKLPQQVEQSENNHQFTVRVIKTNEMQNEFEFYGMSIENIDQAGLLYHNLGVGGASFKAIPTQKLFTAQFPALKADMVILDYGTNDYLYKDAIPDYLDSTIKNVIKAIRMLNPQAVIMLTSTQDMNRKGKNIKSGPAFALLVKKIAFENDCLFYDWYWVSGGINTMTTWEAKELARKDNVHLSSRGYRLKGALFSEAFINTLGIIDKANIKDSVIISDEGYKKLYSGIDTINYTPTESIPAKTIIHKVKKGETLSSISKTYKTSTEKIKKWNDLQSSTLKIGQKLKIMKSKK